MARHRGAAMLAWTSLAILVLLAGPAVPETAEGPVAPEAISVTAYPIAAFRVEGEQSRFGPLEFRGGLVLSSPNPAFGGISAFTLDPRGERFLAITDAGSAISGRLDTKGDRPTGLSDVKIAALLDQQGRPLAAQHREDAESLALSPDAAYVGLEDVNEIWRFPRDLIGANGAPIAVPATVKAMRNNLGLESLFYVPSGPLKGALVGIGEEGIEPGGDLPGVIIGGPTPGDFTIVRSGVFTATGAGGMVVRNGSFSATDAAVTPSGDVLMLERHYTLATGVRMQLRRFPLSQIKPGARIAGQILGTFDMAYQIDNMEGLAVTTNAAGETLVTIVSDDNFNPLQRTVLLRFAIIPD